MDKRYIKLFKDLSQATAITAEQVMKYDKSKKDEKGLQAATIMRDNFKNLAAKINDDFIPTKSDIAQLLVGAMIQANQLQDKMKSLKTALTGYQTDLIPKLQEVLDKSENDEMAGKLAEEKFIIENNE